MGYSFHMHRVLILLLLAAGSLQSIALAAVAGDACCAVEEAPPVIDGHSIAGDEACPCEGDGCAADCADCLCCSRVSAVETVKALKDVSAAPAAFEIASTAALSFDEPDEILHVPISSR